MTTSRLVAPHAGSRSRTVQDDLLQDLRHAAPVTVEPAAADRCAHRSRPALPQTPAAELRVTPRSWSRASLRPLPGGAGLILCLGPFRLSVGLLPT